MSFSLGCIVRLNAPPFPRNTFPVFKVPRSEPPDLVIATSFKWPLLFVGRRSAGLRD
jgi:hypothetical protein